MFELSLVVFSHGIVVPFLFLQISSLNINSKSVRIKNRQETPDFLIICDFSSPSHDEEAKNRASMKIVVVVWIIGYLVSEHLKISMKELVYQFYSIYAVHV